MTKEEKRAYSKLWYAKNKDRVKQQAADWRRANPGRMQAARKAWEQANKEKLNRKQTLYRNTWRKRLIDVLGGQCEQCGFFDIRALELDHRAGDGGKERITSSACSSAGYYKRNAEDPTVKERLACLCANCHRIKTYESDETAPQRKYLRVRINA
jgi:hypothetical protein